MSASFGDPSDALLHTAFSPLGNILALGLRDIKLLDLETGAHIATLGIPGQIDSLAFSRDGKYLAAATWDGFISAIEIWETSAWTSLRNQMVPDANLRTALRISLGKETGAAITHDDLAMLTNFSAKDASIFVLVGLEFATNLEYLSLGGNNIADLSPIAGLSKLHTLSLERNNISDITPLARLTNLTSLHLYDNNYISDISPLSALINLDPLYLAGNRVADTSVLTGLTKLITLHLAVNSHIPLLQDRGVTVSFIDRTPAMIQAISGEEQQGAPSATLLDPFVVEVRDEHGDVFEGVPVTFSVPDGGGMLSVSETMTDADGRAEGILTLGQRTGTITVTVSAAEIAERVTFAVVSEATPPRIRADVNGDGVVNILDLVEVAANFIKAGENNADVNGDGVLNVFDLVQVAGAIGGGGAAPSVHPHTLEQLSAADVAGWLAQAQGLGVGDANLERGVRFLEQLLAALTPEETALLPNYPNPFNPETWIPYHLAHDSEVNITIFDAKGVTVRELALGRQAAGYYADRGSAAYWDGRNEGGESVVSGVYVYRLRAGEYAASRRMVIVK